MLNISTTIADTYLAVLSGLQLSWEGKTVAMNNHMSSAMAFSGNKIPMHYK